MARWEFEAIYKAFSRMVYWAAYGVTKSESDAGDVTQETFIRALKNADKLKNMEEAQIKAWLYRVCINLCMDNKRKHYFSGLQYGDIAAMQGVSEGTVKSRMARAKAKLAKALERR